MSAALLAPDFIGVQSLILYYARKQLYHHISTAATQAMQKRANDPALLFWRAYAALKEGHLADAIRDLDGLRTRNGVQLPALICLKHAHQAAKFPDREAIQQIEAVGTTFVARGYRLRRLGACGSLDVAFAS